jgi:hypothetical protein
MPCKGRVARTIHSIQCEVTMTKKQKAKDVKKVSPLELHFRIALHRGGELLWVYDWRDKVPDTPEVPDTERRERRP